MPIWQNYIYLNHFLFSKWISADFEPKPSKNGRIMNDWENNPHKWHDIPMVPHEAVPELLCIATYCKVLFRTTKYNKELQSTAKSYPVLVRLMVAAHEASSTLRGATFGMQRTRELRHCCIQAASMYLIWPEIFGTIWYLTNVDFLELSGIMWINPFLGWGRVIVIFNTNIIWSTVQNIIFFIPVKHLFSFPSHDALLKGYGPFGLMSRSWSFRWCDFPCLIPDT